jgi:hypothetical protein
MTTAPVLASTVFDIVTLPFMPVYSDTVYLLMIIIFFGAISLFLILIFAKKALAAFLLKNIEVRILKTSV